jgi:hypothetical protein
MSFENYFFSLLQETGCEKIVLVRDDAVAPRKQHRNKKQMAKKSIADRGPPSVPFRKESNDKLVSLARGSTSRSPYRTKRLKKFFDEVAPGLTARNESKSLFLPQLSLKLTRWSSKPILQGNSAVAPNSIVL